MSALRSLAKLDEELTQALLLPIPDHKQQPLHTLVDLVHQRQKLIAEDDESEAAAALRRVEPCAMQHRQRIVIAKCWSKRWFNRGPGTRLDGDCAPRGPLINLPGEISTCSSIWVYEVDL